MTDVMIVGSGEIVGAPKLRVNAHGWVEHHDENGSIVALTPPGEVTSVVVGVERFVDDEEEIDLDDLVDVDLTDPETWPAGSTWTDDIATEVGLR